MLTISGTFVCTRRDGFGRSFPFLFLAIQKEEEQIEEKKEETTSTTLAFYGSGQTLSPQPPPPGTASSIFFLFEFLQCDGNCCQQKEEAKAKADVHVAHQPYLVWHLIFTISIQCFSQRCAKKKNPKKKKLEEMLLRVHLLSLMKH